MKRLDINSLHETFLCFKKDNRCKKDNKRIEIYLVTVA